MLAVATPIAALIVTTILKLVELKKATKGKPPASVSIDGNNNTVIITTVADNTKIVVPREVYELYQSKALDGDLSKIVAPLAEGKVEAVSLSAHDASGPIAPVVITSSEKGFFRGEEIAAATSKPVELEGRFISLNKESNRGTFKMQNGAKVKYHFSGEDPIKMHSDFAYKGPVRVECIATFDNNLELKGLDIKTVAKLQPDLPF